MRIAARRVPLKPLSHEAPGRCGMVQQDRRVGFGGDIREPRQTPRWSNISTRHAALPSALSTLEHNRHRAPGVALADLAAGGVMGDLTSGAWLGERPDRSELVVWLAINVARGGAFLLQALADLLDRGALSAAQEEALRRCLDRVRLRDARLQVPVPLVVEPRKLAAPRSDRR